MSVGILVIVSAGIYSVYFTSQGLMFAAAAKSHAVVEASLTAEKIDRYIRGCTSASVSGDQLDLDVNKRIWLDGNTLKYLVDGAEVDLVDNVEKVVGVPLFNIPLANPDRVQINFGIGSDYDFVETQTVEIRTEVKLRNYVAP